MADPSAIDTYYGRWVQLYDAIARGTPGIPELRRRAAESLALRPGDKVLEFGCGTGANLPYLSKEVGSAGTVIGVDLTEGVLLHGKRRIDREGWTAHLIRGDAMNTPVTGSVDGILATFVVGMLDDPEQTIKEWCELLAPNGRITLLDAHPSPHPLGRHLNPLFNAFVRITSPPGTRFRYDQPPAQVLEQRVVDSSQALAEMTNHRINEHHLLGFIRLTSGQKI